MAKKFDFIYIFQNDSKFFDYFDSLSMKNWIWDFELRQAQAGQGSELQLGDIDKNLKIKSLKFNFAFIS